MKYSHWIRSQFCTCHDSSAVVTCENLWLLLESILCEKECSEDLNRQLVNVPRNVPMPCFSLFTRHPTMSWCSPITINIPQGMTQYFMYSIIRAEYIPWKIHTVLLCFVLLLLYYQLLKGTCDLFTYIFQDCFTGTVTIVWLSHWQHSNLDEFGWNESVHNHSKIQQSVNNVCHYCDVIMGQKGSLGSITNKTV